MSTETVPGTQSWLRERNERTALSLLLEHGELTRNRLSELSGLSKVTASHIVGNLESTGLIEVAGSVPGGRGPSAASYAIRPTSVLGVAIDIDEKAMRSTVVDAYGREHPVAELARSRASRDRSAVSDVTESIAAACAASGVEESAVSVVCIGIPGAVDPRTDQLRFVGDLPGWPRRGIRRHLEDALGREVVIENDANLAAIAERKQGAGTDVSSFALVWMGHGLGLSVDLDGHVHRGVSGGAGEIDYLEVPKRSAALDPGAETLQDLIGGPALIRLARVHGVKARSYQELVVALAGHPQRLAVLEDLAPRIAMGVMPVLSVLDPERVVLGGPTGQMGGAELAELVQRSIRHSSHWLPDVVTTAVPDSTVLRGVQELVITKVRDLLFKKVGSTSD
ncbi:ROK family transcriptional regulator [Cellulomonas sp. P24]|uniref:ROK family transcriptional regulator n=1 Tax=Cellulomonas sp. P24 TaxID=2885206 RepID=UPI00216B4948|nr:ROK family transcriptional regulator [Cellulomonas sp. P24]MCR6493648.1 ROK family transcriptional regulator [Cellulomonas sp. P24]